MPDASYPPDTIPIPTTLASRAAYRRNPTGTVTVYLEIATSGLASRGLHGGPTGWHVIAVIPSGAMVAYERWSSENPQLGRRYVGAAYSLWNSRFYFRGGSPRSFIPRLDADPQSAPPRTEARPGVSPVSVPTILALIYAAGQTAGGSTNRVSEALRHYRWEPCGTVTMTNYPTWCPPLPGPKPEGRFVPGTVVGTQARFD